MFKFAQLCHHPISSVRGFAALVATVSPLLFNPIPAHAEQGVALLNMQTVAEANALELGSVTAEDHWTRIEFSKVYADPVVIVEPVNNKNNAYIVGVRNVDNMGFEINLKDCNKSNGIPLQETIAYSVIDNTQLPPTDQTKPSIRQHFAWGECATSTAS
jgi:hypothetical protein